MPDERSLTWKERHIHLLNITLHLWKQSQRDEEHKEDAQRQRPNLKTVIQCELKQPLKDR